MKVIKEPVPVTWNIEQECIANINYGDIGCGAVLEVDISDVYTKNQMKSGWSDFYDESYTYTVQLFAFRCPCCGKETSIDDKIIPDKIRKVILNGEKEKKELEKKKKLK